MALTDEEKRKIREEEKYRKSISKNKKKKSSCVTGCLIIFVAFIVMYVYMDSKSVEYQQTARSNAAIEQVESTKGTYLNYSYTLMWKESEKRYAATFSPHLERDDSIVIGAMQTLVKNTFSQNIDGIFPDLVEKNGINTFLFQTQKGDYYALPIKGDTGEIHTLVFWEE